MSSSSLIPANYHSHKSCICNTGVAVSDASSSSSAVAVAAAAEGAFILCDGTVATTSRCDMVKLFRGIHTMVVILDFRNAVEHG